MSQSTWHNTVQGLYAATDKAYMRKSARQRRKREVQKVMSDIDGFVRRKKQELKTATYHVGPYRHIDITDTKKPRRASVLPYEDRCVQNALKESIEPLVLRHMTDDMLGGLPGRGVVATVSHNSVVRKMRETMNDRSLRYYLQGDISKFYDNVDKPTSMRLIEHYVKDPRTLAVIRQHLFNQKRLAIGDPISHLIANLNMSVIIRKAKAKYGHRIRLINFADDFIAFAKNKATLNTLRRDMRQWAKQMRLHYKPMYVHPVPGGPVCCNTIATTHPVTFCGYRFGRSYVHLTRRTKLRYIRARHRRRSVASYNGLLQVADTRHLRHLVETNNNKHMADKIRRPFAGRPMKIETLEGIPHTIVDMSVKASRQKDTDSYMHIQAIAEGLGLFVYSTGAAKICEFLKTKSRQDLPLRDMKIVHDWSGFYYDGTVYTDAEEEEMIRQQFNIPRK